jgi:hypothetical protein
MIGVKRAQPLALKYSANYFNSQDAIEDATESSLRQSTAQRLKNEVTTPKVP